MNSDIQLEMRLSSLLAAYPETRPVFLAHGLGRLVTEEALKAIGPFLSLETALNSHGVAPETFLGLLRQCDSGQSPGLSPLDAPGMPEEPRTQAAATLLTLMPCGLKVPFARALARFMDTFQGLNNEAVEYFVESNLNHELSYYPYVSHIENLDELPDIIVSSDFNSFFHHRFYKRFVEPGHFVDVMDYPPNATFFKAGIADPQRQYTILCVNPLVIVADLEKTGHRPLPRRWADLLDPIWRRSITMRGNEHFFCHAVLMPLYKEHGPEAMQALAHNVLDGRHPAEMVKSAGSGRSAALYLMPHFFAHKIPARKAVKVIWPEDGALASPVSLLVKKEKAARLKPITDYLTGEELARVFAGAFFPSPHPAVEAGAALEGPLKWLGWDYIRANDMAQINAEIDLIFLPAVQEGGRP